MTRYILLLLILVLLWPTTGATQEKEDILGKILSEVGFQRTDIGFEPKGYWNRFPLDIPHRLTSFDDLFAEPLKLYDYATTMGNAAELYLDPSYADTAEVVTIPPPGIDSA